MFSTVNTMGDIMSTMGVILTTVEDTQHHGGYYDACGDTMSTVGCSVPWRIPSFEI